MTVSGMGSIVALQRRSMLAMMADDTVERDVAELLVTGGLDVDRSGETKYEPARNPVGAERLAALLAKKIAPLRPSALVVWDDPDDIVLAHLVGLHLNLRWIRCYEQADFVRVVGAVMPGDRLVFVADAVREDTPLNNIRLAIELTGARLTGVAVFLGTVAALRATAQPLAFVSLIQR